MSTRFTLLAMTALVVIVAISACEDNPISPYKPIVVNNLDNFHFKIDEVNNHDTLLIYYWRTEGSSANINQLSSISGGQASLRIVGPSPDTTETYSTDFTVDGDFRSESSYPGAWKITIRLIDFSGMIEFRVQRR